MKHTIEREALLRKLLSATRPTLVEALPAKYYADKHLPGAINIPHNLVDELASASLPDKDADIVVYCANVQCQDSNVAAHRLQSLGYANVSIYRGGKQDWEAAGLPFDSPAGAAGADTSEGHEHVSATR